MKICTKCGLEKRHEEFNKDSTKKDGLYSSCRDCYQEYYQSIRARKLEYKRKYRQQNKERISAYRVEHYRDNRVIQINQAKECAQKNPLKRRANEAKRRSA
ncbi:hypothetical protein A3717_39465 [Alcanivorax sp. HI0013]|nr:hypothetical protein A3717_39465 [Alcanivorax sp. HI0013]